MRTKVILGLFILILAVLNYSVYDKHQLKEHGDVMLLELASVDPRSLMQGDYMRLSYTLENTAQSEKDTARPLDRPLEKRGYMVIRPDEDTVAQFVRFHENGQLKAGEKRLRFHYDHSRIRIMPNSFFFQEGHAALYENAKYGIFRLDDAGNHLLTGLADENRQQITP